ncbi:hypothetical protein ABBQ32_008313 [Trebouxia sp. C0010 RCD-2024]
MVFSAGDIMFCDGSCMRAFHCGIERLLGDSASDSEGDALAASPSCRRLREFRCNPLGMPLDLYQHLKDTKDTFHCPNCLAGVHQCFKCKQEGVVEAHAANPHNARFANEPVFRCGVASCGRFYHAACVEKTEEEMQAAFLCPLHTCKRCGGDESNTGKGELVPCRRCPKAFHEHCMPASLLDLPGKNGKQRIWIAHFENGECVSEVERSLIYCGAHKIQDDTPEHVRPVFSRALLKRWRVHFAHVFPNLVSSQKVLAQVELTENLPLGDRFKQMSGRARGIASNTPATSNNVAAPRQLGSSKRLSAGLNAAAVLAGGQPTSSQSKALQTKPVASAVPSSIGGAKRAGSLPLAPSSDRAVPSRMGPPPACKRPSHPDGALLPAKKRQAVERALLPIPTLAATQPIQGNMQASKSASAIISQQEAGMPPLLPKRLLRAGLPKSADSQLPKPGGKHAYARDVPAGPTAVMPAAGTAIADLLEPQTQTQSDDRHNPGDSVAMPSFVEAREPAEDRVGVTAAAAAVAKGAAPVATKSKAAVQVAVEADPAPYSTDTPSDELQLTTEYARRLQAMSHKERKAEAQQRMEQIVQACTRAGRVTLDKVVQNTRQPEPYRNPSKNTIAEERLSMIEKAVAAAEKDPARANCWVNASIAREMLMHEDNMSMVLAPFLHGKRYSSYGRHFTKLVLLRQVAQMLSFYLHDGDTMVDFSCGANAFVPLVKQEGAKQGLTISGCSFDIITSQNLEDFQRCSWMDVRPGDLPVGDRLVIGLNPPFGKNNMLASMFVRHAATFHPRVIVLIVPPGVRIPRGYQVMYEEQDTMRDRAFFVPGSKNESWNKVPPALRVLLRQDRVNTNPPEGTGWYPTAITPMYGTRCRPRQALVQPLIPRHPLPPQQMLWQQGPPHLPPLQQQQHGFPRPMLHAQQPYSELQHAQQTQQAQYVQQHHSQQAQYMQQHHSQQQHMVARQPSFAGQIPPLPPLPGQPQQTQVVHAQQPAQPPFPPGYHATGRPARLSMPVPPSLPGSYR